MSGPETNELIEKLEVERKELTQRLSDVGAKLIKRIDKNASDAESIKRLDLYMDSVKVEIEMEVHDWVNINKTCEATRLLEYELPIHMIKNKISFMEKFYLY
jgi:predicted transcriptional regulator